jgi:Aerotolerance regulator N-terminal/von Willebrand factor type A domain
MFGLTVLNPLFLWGMSLGAVPIIIHLLQRRRYRVRRWAAMEFLQLSVRNTARRLRLEQILLLVLRALILMLAALALARPVANTAALPLLSRNAHVHATLLLDNSYSMGYRPPTADRRPMVGVGSALDGRRSASTASTNFERARERALELIRDGLRQGDSVSVILAGDPPQALIRRPTFDLAGAARQIRAAPLSDTGTDFAKAARLCLETLKDAPHPNREVYLITDNQARGWTNGQTERLTALPAASRAVWRELAARARLNVVAVGEPAPQNVAVLGVGPTHGLVTTRDPTLMEARVANYGDRPQTGLLATLIVDGRAGASTRVDLPAHGEATVRFTQLFPTPGVHAGSVRVTPDRLPRDNEAFFRLAVRDRLRVLCLNGRPSAEPQRDAAFYLTYALSPAIDGAPQGIIQPTVLSGNSFGGANLRGYDVVILADVGALGAADTRALEHFVQDGGGALIFLGESTDRAYYNRLHAERPSLMPARLESSRSAAGAPPSLDAASIDHPALARFKNAGDIDLGTAEFERYFALALQDSDRSARVMCRFTNGLPAIVEKSYGLGKVVLVASSSGAEGNNLPYKPAYLPLLHQMVAYLAQGPDGAKNLTVGDRLVKTLDLADGAAGGRPLDLADARFRLTEPDGDTTTLRPVALDPGRGPVIRFDRTRRAGLYQLSALRSPLSVKAGTTLTESGERRAESSENDVFAVNLPAGEGDLRPLSRGQLARLLPDVHFGWVDPNQPLAAALRQARLGVELWRPLVIAVMLLMLLESFLAQRFGRG